jgi:hypothetical protein
VRVRLTQMSWVITTTPQNARLAGRVARRVDLWSIELLDASFRVWPGQLGRGRYRKPAPLPIQLSVSTSESAEVEGRRLRALITLRLTGSVGPGARKSKVLRSRCKFVTEYSLPSGVKPTAAELQAFAKTNALLNIWPYWREYVQSMAVRAGLPRLMAPLLQVRVLPPQPRASRAAPGPK